MNEKEPTEQVVTPRAPLVASGPGIEAKRDTARPGGLGWRERVRRIPSPRGAMIVFLAAGLVIASTFLNWVQGSTGWNIVYRSFGTSGFFPLTWWSSGLLFSGFWSLALGILVAAGAVLLLLGRDGGRLLIPCGVVGAAIAVFDIVMVWFNGGFFPDGPALGLWLFLVGSLCAIALGLSVMPVRENAER